MILVPIALAAAAPDLSGAWRMDVNIVSRAKVPVFGEIESASISKVDVTITRDGEGWRMRQVVCASHVESRFARTTLPPALLRSLPPREHPVLLDGSSFIADPGPEALGWRGARFPTSAADPNIFDQDGDGRPGVTVVVDVPLYGRGEIWLVQHAHSVYRGTVVSPDRIEGKVETVFLRQLTLGASAKMFEKGPESTPVPERSTFVLTRAPAGGCP